MNFVNKRNALKALGSDATIAALGTSGLTARSPINGQSLGTVTSSIANTSVDQAITTAAKIFRTWRAVPAPVRGEVVRHLGIELRAHKESLADLVQIEVGKIRSEALGEVQEMIDICDFAVGLSRQIHGLTIASERPQHRLTEAWQPLGPVGVISAFNFPVAVWSWNAALALVSGDTVIWKPSDLTPLTALATTTLVRRAALAAGAPVDVCQVVFGGASVGAALAADHRVAVLSATGSTRMGRAVAPVVAARFGRSILELGGNNAAIIAPSADLDLAVRGITFSAAGTAGQRCTTLRRLIVHESRIDEVCERVGKAYNNLRVGSPLESNNLVGPLINLQSLHNMQAAIKQAEADGGVVVAGGQRHDSPDSPRPPTFALRWCACPRRPTSLRPKPLPPFCMSCRIRLLTKPLNYKMVFHKAWPPVFSRLTCVKPKGLRVQLVATAELPTSISVPQAPKSAEHSVARRKLEADVKAEAIVGRRTCDAKPRPLTIPINYPSPKALSLSEIV